MALAIGCVGFFGQSLGLRQLGKLDTVSRMRTNRLAFTLLELLVVIAVIAILSGLMIPGFAKLRERGRCVRCASNLRQLHLAAVAYANDRGGRLPRAQTTMEYYGEEELGPWHGWLNWNDNAESQRRTEWHGADARFCITNDTGGDLFSYVGGVGDPGVAGTHGDEIIYLCPTFAAVCGEDDPYRSYGMNGTLSWDFYHAIPGPTRTILFADQGLDRRSSYSLSSVGNWRDPEPPEDTRAWVRFHRELDGAIDWQDDGGSFELIGEYHLKGGAEAANCVFVDGHVERVRYTKTTNVCSGAWGDGVF